MAGDQTPDTGGPRKDARLSAFLDTNVLIRHLTGEPPAQARRATAFLERADELLVPDLVIAEVVYVLECFYEVERIDFAEAYLVAGAEASGVESIASFDRSIDRVTTIQRIEPS